jgi:hypothetical protein
MQPPTLFPVCGSLDSYLTPNSIEWWAWIEKKYSRKVIKSDKNEYTNIGFFGANKVNLNHI